MAASGEIGATLTTGNGSAKEPDDFNREQGDSGVGGRLASQQREADEHLFLRYLELDPIEGPDAAPAAVQRKASGNKAGRTPFTTTRRLDRGGDQGFGFSVLWTRPPRIERVDPGRAADRAGLHPGDYIVFVDRHNVVTLPESQVLTLIKSSGSQLILETFRRSTHGGEIRAAARGSLTSHLTLSDAAPCSPRPLLSLHHHLQNQLQAQSQSQSQSQSQQSAGNRDSGGDWSQARAGRPSTACSNNTATSAASRRRPTLPQVAFTRESMTALGSTCGGTGIGSGERVRALQAVVAREQIYSQALQFGVERYVAPLSSRSDIITPAEHALLFQNCEELLRLSEDILEQLVSEEGEVQIHLVASVYLAKMPTIISLYKTYCNGLKRADCVLVQKSRQQGGGFVRSVTEPPVPRRRPDVTQLVHKPLEQFRELLRLLRAARAAVPASHSDHPALARLVNDLQNAYHEVTASAGLMGPLGEGRPLLSVADLESRLVFTRCKPFILSKPGRQWIFGGDLGRVEGRTVRPFWGLLFTDLLLFATVSRDRVLFITEEPLAIANITETCFNIRKRTNEFRLGVGAGRAGSPTARCGPPARTRARTLALRAPSADLKAVWQSLLLRQICRVNSSTGTPLSSPMESPAPLGCYSEVTLDSQQRQINLAEREVTTRNETGVCAANRASRQPCKGAALHLARWMRSHPGSGPLEPEPEIWSTEQLRKRSRELRLIDIANLAEVKSPQNTIPAPAHIEKSPSEQSPSRSTNSDSQITVRSSPVVPETVAVCRQCHKRCFSKPGSPQISAKTPIAEEKPNSSSSPVNNSLLHSTYSCQKKSPVEELKQCINNCANNNCVVENKVKDVSPERNKSQNTSDVETERKSPSIAIRKSREEFFKMTTPKEPCSSPFDRSFKSPSPRSPCSQRSDSSRSTHFSTNSPLSYAHTTCSSMALSTSTGKKSQSPGRDSNASGSSGREEIVQCVIAQEKYLNEVKCVENIMLSKNCGYRNKLKDFGKLYQDTSKSGDDKKFSASMTGKQCLVGDSIGYTDRVNSSFTTSHADFFSGAVKTTVNGHLNIDDDRDSLSGKNTSDMSWGPLMLMGLSAMNPAAHLLALDRRPVSARGSPYHSTASNTTTTTLGSSQVPNIAVVPPTPDYKSDSHILTTQHTLEESPDDSPLAEEPPYLALKRYGTMSSLERLPSDEIDDATIEVETVEKDVDTSQGLLGWTARAGSYVAEKMALLNSLAESGVASTGGSFLERYLGAGEWRSVRGVSISGGETEPGEGSGASGEEAWGTPSSGDLSDHAFPDSDHATLSSPTKSSSSCPGDEDTELMMDELLMTPPIAGPSLRPLLPRRRLEPLLEEDGSDATSNSSGDTTSEITTSPTKDQGSTSGVGSGGDERAAAGWGTSPDRTPTNHTAHPPILVSTVLRGSPQLSSGGGSPSSSTLSGDTPLPLLLGSMDPLTPLSTPHSSLPPSPAVLRAALGAAAEAAQNQQDAPTSRLSPRMEMRLALSEGRDILAEQDQLWDQVSGRCGWVRRPMAIAAAPRPCQRPRSLVAHQNTTLSNSVSVHQGGPKVTAMERLALLEARGARRGGRRPRPSARLMGLVRRRASSDSPERRPYSPRRQPPHVSNQGYYKICFVNGFV